ncbi:MAG: hypothetical protein COZ91_03365 [Candidatus Nealsonbacteria bacterium CG_4_8_14_3_um_filter_39_7]|nr:MAG: hypothetical protein COZ91_03365 [Candidatus Nealsonbacteria bacterium CG_4_8_14_3_um_filter_39_7]
MGREKYLTNNDQEFLYIQLEESEKKESLEIGENIIIDVEALKNYERNVFWTHNNIGGNGGVMDDYVGDIRADRRI